MLTTNARENVVVAEGHVDVRASTATMSTMPTTMILITLGEILGASFRDSPSLDLDLAFGAIDSNVDLACTRLLFPPSPLHPLLLLLLLMGSPSEIQDFS